MGDEPTPQHSMVQTDRVPDTSKDSDRYTEPTPIERWQRGLRPEPVGQHISS
jgi:hypothetical protein